MLSDGHIPNTESFVIACKRGDQTLVLKLLDYPNIDFHTGFLGAVEYGRLHLLDHLYTRVDINKPDEYGDNALYLVHDIQVLKWLLDMGANCEGGTLLHRLVCDREFEMVKLLLEYGATQTLDHRGFTPMDYARWYNIVKMIQLLEKYSPKDK
jgi:ankyrin repeat protein